MNRLLIIGASEFIGQHLLQRLQSFPEHQVSGTYHAAMPQIQGCSWHQADVTDPEQLGEVFWLARPEVVAPLAAMADVNQCQRMPQQSTEIKLRGIEHITRLCALQRVMLALLVVVADTDDEAARLASQIKVVRIRLRRGRTLTTGTVAAAERFGQQSGESFESKVYDAPVVHSFPEVALGKLFKMRIRSYELLSEALTAA